MSIDKKIIRFGGGGGGKGGGGKTDVDYHWCYSISEVKLIGDSSISWNTTLGNIVHISDGENKEFYLPNYWKKKVYIRGGYKYEKTYPAQIILYKNSISNILKENEDYTYDRDLGKITLVNTPNKGDLFAVTCTYDPEQPELTTFYASFAFAELYKRIGIKPYKFKDDYLDTKEKVCIMSKNLIDSLWVPIMSGELDLVYNPKLSIGQTIYVKDKKTGFDNAIFVVGYNKRLGDNLSCRANIIACPITIDVSQFNVDVENFKFYLPYLQINFISYREDLSDVMDTGLYFKSQVVDLYSNLYVFYSENLNLYMILNEKTKKIPSLENNLNSQYPKIKTGNIFQYYIFSPRKCSNGEFPSDTEFKNYFPEFFEDEPKYLSSKQVTFKIENPKNMRYESISQHIYFAKAPIFQGYNIPCYPYNSFSTFFGNGDYIAIVDSNKDLWLIDTLFDSKKIDNLNFLNEYSLAINSDGRNLYIINNRSSEIIKYNILTKETVSYQSSGLICGNTIFIPYKLVQDQAGNSIINIRGISCAETLRDGYSKIMFDKIKTDEAITVSWRLNDSLNNTGKCHPGIPYVFRNQIYFGRIAFGLKYALEYEGNYIWQTEYSCPIITDNSNKAFPTFNKNDIKSVYISDYIQKNLYVLGVENIHDVPALIQTNILEGKRISIGRRIDLLYDESFDPSEDSDHWECVGILDTSNSNDLLSWRVSPLCVYGNKILCYVSGNELKRKIDRFLNWSLGYIDLTNKTLNLILGKFYGDSMWRTNTELSLCKTIYFRDKTLINWKDYTNLLNVEPFYTFKLINP